MDQGIGKRSFIEMQMMAQHFPPEGGVSSFVYFFLATQIANDKMIQLIFLANTIRAKKLLILHYLCQQISPERAYCKKVSKSK